MGLAGCNFFPGLFFILFSHFCSFMAVWGLGFWGCGLGLGFWAWGFQLIGFGPCGVGPSVVLSGRGSLYKHRGITLGKTLWLAEA